MHTGVHHSSSSTCQISFDSEKLRSKGQMYDFIRTSGQLSWVHCIEESTY